ncbi:DoxX family protein [Rhodococcus spongiicola]|uniref:DoxX family protein n=1 Tax=Rhodococcus spongiicola TaxID=2487352 RepID=A0A438ASU1_9NOCA|nr:DoxX family protein [Rhodococcus spongiicola]RVW01757.1 DoxX family protein [Rhodococcus spongiicola]
MIGALFIATLLCIVANAFIAVADYLEADFVLKNSADVGVPVAALPHLGTAKLVGAIGLVVGLLALPWVGVAAGIGLTVYFVGAVAVCIRARVYNVAFPGLYLLLAGASTAYFILVMGGA